METISEKYRDLFERPISVSLATLMKDGTPQVQPVWCSYDGRHLLVNTVKGRQKYRNLALRRVATILAVDPQNDDRWVEIRGRVVEETEQGADEHSDRLAKRYLGLDKYPWNAPGDVRVIFRIAPERVVTLESSMPALDTTTT
jgi:PPOX class probable F420-dependent enzyme